MVANFQLVLAFVVVASWQVFCEEENLDKLKQKPRRLSHLHVPHPTDAWVPEARAQRVRTPREFPAAYGARPRGAPLIHEPPPALSPAPRLRLPRRPIPTP